jgi:hypothetical protein
VEKDTGSDGSMGIVGPGEGKCLREGVGNSNKEPVTGAWTEE